MITTLDRRHAERARIPCRIPVELTDERYSAAFEADAVDLSVGGLSLRASSLPELGKHLLCSFESMPGGAHVLGRGEVVWVQPCGDVGGEFGLRFVGIDPKTQALIDEMVAERIARIDTPFAGAAPVIANLEIENVDTPIAATLVRTDAGEALFEQPLDLLAIGKSVVAHAGVSLVRGSIARVDLRMDGETPMLALTVRLAQEPAQFGEFEWEDSGPDTEPDLFAPAGLSNAPAAPAARPRAQDQMSLVFRHEAETQPTADKLVRQSDGDDVRLRLELSMDDDEELADSAYVQQLPSTDREESYVFGQTGGDDWTHPLPDVTPKAPLVQVLRVFAALQGVWQRSIGFVVGGVGRLRRQAGQRIVSGTNRIVAQTRPRRTTAPAVGRPGAENRGTWRLLGLGMMSIAAVALFAYALAPAAREDLLLHRQLQPAAAALHDDAKPGAAAPSAPGSANMSTATPAGAAAATSATAPTLAAATPAAGVVPAGSPYAVDVRANRAPLQPAAEAKSLAGGSAFGQKQIPNAKRFVLRMSSPIKAVQGSSDSHGFNVVIPGSLALDRAAPIAANNPAVARAMIINRGNRSELSVRFADGRTPAYRVSGQGAALEVLIGH
jgi:hypothetical protein